MADETIRALERRFRETNDAADREAWLRAKARAGVAPGVGLVFLDDLQTFAPWMSDRAPAWRARRGLEGELLPPTVFPPPVVVVVAARAPSDPPPVIAPAPLSAEALERSAGWLGLASAVVVVRGEGVDEGLARELMGPVEAWIRARAAGRDAAIDEALARAARIAGGEWRWWSATPATAAAPTGPWIEWPAPQSAWPVPELGFLAAGLCIRDGLPSLLDAVTGDRIELVGGARAPVDGLAGTAARGQPMRSAWPHVAAAPGGAAWLWSPDYRSFSARLEGRDAREFPEGHGQAIGYEPAGRVAWGGTRTCFHWRVAVAPDFPVFWTPSLHHWPCGHAKKLLGFKDNRPLWVHLAPDASACLSVYEHDVLLAPGLPLRWRDLGPFALAERQTGEPRALFFQCPDADAETRYGGGPDGAMHAEEDARDRRATVTLGPSSDARYAVGLEAPTYRLAKGEVVRLGGPADEWVVYDAEHRERARRPGRLLAGWDRWVVVLRDGALERIDLVDDRVEPLGPPGRPVTDALAVPGTPNVVLIHQADGEASIRLV